MCVKSRFVSKSINFIVYKQQKQEGVNSNSKYYLLVDEDTNALPSRSKALALLNIADEISQRLPHLIYTEKRLLANRQFSFFDKLKNGRNYPFKNGMNDGTKGQIVWTDRYIYYWPLIISLLKLHPTKSIEHFNNLLFDSGRLQWNKILPMLADAPKYDYCSVDTLDKWYDEISTTQIKPQSYHKLYFWLGADTKHIGYHAFDLYMKERNGTLAWTNAINSYLSEIKNLRPETQQEIMGNYLNILLKQ